MGLGWAWEGGGESIAVAAVVGGGGEGVVWDVSVSCGEVTTR